MRQRIAALGLASQVRVISAGTWAEEGHAASAHAVTTLAGRGIDLAGHQSQPMTAALLAEADIVLVMEEAHRRSLFHLAPQHLRKVYLLTEMCGQHEDVEDPYGGPPVEYARTADLLEQWIDAGLPRVLKQLNIER